MKYKTYEEHLEKWKSARRQLKSHNEELIRQWRAIPWWQFWKKPSFEDQRHIIIGNWQEFDKLPRPQLADYYPMNL